MLNRNDLPLCKSILVSFSKIVGASAVQEMRQEFNAITNSISMEITCKMIPGATAIDELTQQFNAITDTSSWAQWQIAANYLQHFISNFRGPGDRTAMFYLNYFEPATIKLLVDAWLNPNEQKHAGGVKPLGHAIRSWCEPATIQALIDNGADPRDEDALCAAIKSNKECENHDNELKKYRPITETSFSKSLKILNILLAYKPNLNFVLEISKFDPETPLILAVRRRNLDALRMLLTEQNSDPCFLAPNLMTPLSAATYSYSKGWISLDFIEELLKSGADPYQLAVYRGNRTLCSSWDTMSMEEFQADKKAPLLQLLNQYEKNKINPLAYWTKHKERINKPDIAGLTPLHYAVFMQDKAAVEALLQLGANQNAELQNKKPTALFFTIKGWRNIYGILKKDDPIRLEIAQLLITKLGKALLTDSIRRAATDRKDREMTELFSQNQQNPGCLATFFKCILPRSNQIAPSSQPLEATSSKRLA